MPGQAYSIVDVAELRIHREDVGPHHGAQPRRLARVGGDAAAPQQAILVDDAVVVAGAARVADGAAPADGLAEPRAELAGHRDVGRHRQDRGAEPMDAAEIGIARQHDMARRDLAHGRPELPLRAAALEGPRLGGFVHLHAAALGVGRQRQREVERMDLEALRIVQPLEVALGDRAGRAPGRSPRARTWRRASWPARAIARRSPAPGRCARPRAGPSPSGCRVAPSPSATRARSPRRAATGRRAGGHGPRPAARSGRPCAGQSPARRSRRCGPRRPSRCAGARPARPSGRAWPAGAPCAGRRSLRPRSQRLPRPGRSDSGRSGVASRVAAYQLAG